MQDELVKLAERLESAAMRTIDQHGMDFWVLRQEVAYTANCFTVAAALRARAALTQGKD